MKIVKIAALGGLSLAISACGGAAEPELSEGEDRAMEFLKGRMESDTKKVTDFDIETTGDNVFQANITMETDSGGTETWTCEVKPPPEGSTAGSHSCTGT